MYNSLGTAFLMDISSHLTAVLSTPAEDLSDFSSLLNPAELPATAKLVGTIENKHIRSLFWFAFTRAEAELDMALAGSATSFSAPERATFVSMHKALEHLRSLAWDAAFVELTATTSMVIPPGPMYVVRGWRVYVDPLIMTPTSQATRDTIQ